MKFVQISEFFFLGEKIGLNHEEIFIFFGYRVEGCELRDQIPVLRLAFRLAFYDLHSAPFIVLRDGTADFVHFQAVPFPISSLMFNDILDLFKNLRYL